MTAERKQRAESSLFIVYSLCDFGPITLPLWVS